MSAEKERRQGIKKGRRLADIPEFNKEVVDKLSRLSVSTALELASFELVRPDEQMDHLMEFTIAGLSPDEVESLITSVPRNRPLGAKDRMSGESRTFKNLRNLKKEPNG